MKLTSAGAKGQNSIRAEEPPPAGTIKSGKQHVIAANGVVQVKSAAVGGVKDRKTAKEAQGKRKQSRKHTHTHTSTYLRESTYIGTARCPVSVETSSHSKSRRRLATGSSPWGASCGLCCLVGAVSVLKPASGPCQGAKTSRGQVRM